MRNTIKRTGFTLVEILVALFIFTLIALIMTQALQWIFKLVDATDKTAARLAQMQMAMIIIDRDLQQFIDRPTLNTKGALELSFIGNAHEINFTHGGVNNPDGLETRSTLQRTTFTVEDQQLVRKDWPVLDQLPKTKVLKRTLVDHLNKLEFSFLDNNNKWRSSWPPPAQSINLSPRAVRVNLSFSNWGDLSYVFLLNGKALDG